MGDLAVGDEIFDDLGRSCRVTLTTPIMHGKECYRLTFSDGSTIIADSEHLWEVERKICRRLGTNGPRRHEWKTEVLMTRDMASRVHAADRKRFRYRVRVAQPLQTPVSDLPIDPYVLGIWLGDGTTRSGQITVHESDREILDHIAVCGMWSQVQRRTPTGTLTVALRLPSEDPALCPRGHTLSEVGRYDCGSCKRCCRDRYDGRPMPRRDTFSRRLRTLDLRMNKHIPPAYLRAGIDQRLALLQGLLDSDGTVSAKGNVLFTNTNARLADEFFELAASLGYRPAMRQSKHGAARAERRCAAEMRSRLPSPRMPRFPCSGWEGNAPAFAPLRPGSREMLQLGASYRLSRSKASRCVASKSTAQIISSSPVRR